MLVVLATNLSGGCLISCKNVFIEEEKAIPWFLKRNYSEIDTTVNDFSVKNQAARHFILKITPTLDPDSLNRIKRILEQYPVGGLFLQKGRPSVIKEFVSHCREYSDYPLMIALSGSKQRFIDIPGLPEFYDPLLLQAYGSDTLFRIMGNRYSNIMHYMGANTLLNPPLFTPFQLDSVQNHDYVRFQAKKNQSFRKAYYQNNVLSPYVVPLSDSYMQKNPDTSEWIHEHLKSVIDNRLNAFYFDFKNTADADVMLSVMEKADSMNFKGLMLNDYFVNNPLDTARMRKWIARGMDMFVIDRNVDDFVAFTERLAIRDSVIRKEFLQDRKKILQAAEWTENISSEADSLQLREGEFTALKSEMYKNSVTVLRNHDTIIPLKDIHNPDIAVVSIGTNDKSIFQKHIGKYTRIDHYPISTDASPEMYTVLKDHLNTYDIIITGVHLPDNRRNDQITLSRQAKNFIEQIAITHKTIIALFGKPKKLRGISHLPALESLLVGYDNSELAQTKTAEAIFGGIQVRGILSAPLGNRYTLGDGKKYTKDPIRLQYTTPEAVGISSEELNPADSIIRQAIDNEATPGGRLLAAKDQKVFFNKAYGYHTYEKKREVKKGDIYDLASITKIGATTLSLMHYYDKGVFSLDSSLSKFIPALDTTNKKDLKFRNVLGHQARLASWLPFYYDTYNNIHRHVLKKNLFAYKKTEKYSKKVAEDLYVIDSYRDTILREIYKTDLKRRRMYKYSDLGFYLLDEAIRNMAGKSLDKVTDSLFYEPLGAMSTGFNPLDEFKKNCIVPTEDDDYFRDQLINGTVQDRGAALLGGVAGHSGLFSNAGDLAKIMQLLLNKGRYGGEKYFTSSTVELFTSNPFFKRKNHRGLGFDKPHPRRKKRAACDEASDESYGHTGFTGTMVWADPEKDFVFIFLSNRVHPSIENYKLVKNDVRKKIQSVFYEAMTPGEPNLLKRLNLTAD